MSEVVEVGPRDPRFWSYLRLASGEWPWAPAVVVSSASRPSASVMVLEVDGEVVAGGLLTATPANVFLQRRRRLLARAYCAAGLANLSYVAVREDRRGLGYGRELIRILSQQRSFWLACEPSLDDYYRSCGLIRSDEESSFFRTSHLVA